MTTSIEDIDIALYQTTPMLPTEATLTLGLDLFSLKPAGAPPQVEKAAMRMFNTASLIKQALVDRVEQAGIDAGMEVGFDGALDRFWAGSRYCLLTWMNYGHDGLELLSDDEQSEIDLEDKREKAELARELEKHLFGIDGLAFLRKPFNQQVALMASRLGFIASSEKASAYEELLGPDLLNTLNVLQRRYEAMVRDRSARDDEGISVKQLRHKLQRHISLYANAVISMLDEDKPESIEIVLAALRPMVNTRVPRRSRSGDENENKPAPETEGEPFPNELLEAAPEPTPEDVDSE